MKQMEGREGKRSEGTGKREIEEEEETFPRNRMLILSTVIAVVVLELLHLICNDCLLG